MLQLNQSNGWLLPNVSLPLPLAVTYLYPFLTGTGKPLTLQQVTSRSYRNEIFHFSSWIFFLTVQVPRMAPHEARQIPVQMKQACLFMFSCNMELNPKKHLLSKNTTNHTAFDHSAFVDDHIMYCTKP